MANKNGKKFQVEFGFESVQDFVSSQDVDFVALKALCLGLAKHIDELKRGEYICKKCGLRKDSVSVSEPNF